VRRGKIRWYTFAAPDKRRPVLLLTRPSVIDTLNEIIVAPATRTIRGQAVLVELHCGRWFCGNIGGLDRRDAFKRDHRTPFDPLVDTTGRRGAVGG
jgi:mRNA-degrading endonuclease toxin of MazEF toxin-antitoxin module